MRPVWFSTHRHSCQSASSPALNFARRAPRAQPRAFLLQWVFSAIGIVAVVAFLPGGCGSPTEAPISGEDALRGYISQNRDVNEIFTQTLFPGGVVALQDGDTLRRLELDTAFRTNLSVFIDSVKPETTIYGITYQATATLSHRYTFQYTESGMATSDTVTKTFVQNVSRSALFYRLNGIGGAYQGWELVGHNTGYTPRQTTFPDLVFLTRIPQNGDPVENISAKRRASDTTASLELARQHVYLTQANIFRAGDSIDIRTRYRTDIFAHTASGFRRLSQMRVSATEFHYGFITPPADANSAHYQLITLQRPLEMQVYPTPPPPDTLALPAVLPSASWTFVYALQ